MMGIQGNQNMMGMQGNQNMMGMQGNQNMMDNMNMSDADIEAALSRQQNERSSIDNMMGMQGMQNGKNFNPMMSPNVNQNMNNMMANMGNNMMGNMNNMGNNDNISQFLAMQQMGMNNLNYEGGVLNNSTQVGTNNKPYNLVNNLSSEELDRYLHKLKKKIIDNNLDFPVLNQQMLNNMSSKDIKVLIKKLSRQFSGIDDTDIKKVEEPNINSDSSEDMSDSDNDSEKEKINEKNKGKYSELEQFNHKKKKKRDRYMNRDRDGDRNYHITEQDGPSEIRGYVSNSRRRELREQDERKRGIRDNNNDDERYNNGRYGIREQQDSRSRSNSRDRRPRSRQRSRSRDYSESMTFQEFPNRNNRRNRKKDPPINNYQNDDQNDDLNRSPLSPGALVPIVLDSIHGTVKKIHEPVKREKTFEIDSSDICDVECSNDYFIELDPISNVTSVELLNLDFPYKKSCTHLSYSIVTKNKSDTDEDTIEDTIENKEIDLPNGFYTITRLIDYLQENLSDITFTVTENNKIIVKLVEEDKTLTINNSENSIWRSFGFIEDTYEGNVEYYSEDKHKFMESDIVKLYSRLYETEDLLAEINLTDQSYTPKDIHFKKPITAEEIVFKFRINDNDLYQFTDTGHTMKLKLNYFE